MGIFFQFYLIAYLLYKYMRKCGILFECACIIFTIAMKAFTYAYILPHFGVANQLEFISGRQLVTALDNFTAGMYIAYLTYERKFHVNKIISLVGGLISLILIYIICCQGMVNGIHTNNISGYTWHSFLSIGIGVTIFFFSQYDFDNKHIVTKGLLWIAKYEYEIYIWHLLIINNLLEGSPIIHTYLNRGLWSIVCLMLIGISICAGFIFSKTLNPFTERLFASYISKKPEVKNTEI